MNFRIVHFDEINDPYKVTTLFQLGLFYSATPKLLEEIRSNDDRYTAEFGIFAVTEDGTVAGGHLLMRIPTETTNGRLDVGGVNAVATRPDFGRQGVMTAIMNATHQYFRDQKLELSVLTTSGRLGAMILYEQLGYAELSRSSVALKHPNQTRATRPPDILVCPFSENDVEDVDRVYRQVVAGSYGFIHRPNNFLKARKYAAGEMKPKDNLKIAKRGEIVMGYAYWESNPRISEAYEIMALDMSSFQALLADAEQRSPEASVMVWCDGLTGLEVEWLRRTGYQVPIETYGRVMVKSLDENTNQEKLRVFYGVESGKFRLGPWDGT